ncbi:hypothetical protein E4U42_000857 [Claviceps africana]|uniref:Maltose/galactoside acetyltransferase domain-containing protein n=1 Tax=Claviceps africana TaxID=83212 RepID=A0A8K0JA94_9HYPO|nr:hypothetical protein E4U42_000857 [Claviceps africana]
MASQEKKPEIIAFAKTLSNVPWCEQYERMISGQLYNALDQHLIDGRFRARRLMHKYNNHFPDDATSQSLTADRQAMLEQMLGRVGKNVFIEPPLSIDYGCNISIGHTFYANFNLVILDCGMIKIGNRVMFGPSVSLFAATHETDVQLRRRDGAEYAGSIEIGDDCWIGGNAIIMPGVTIGKGCTIGSGSVVTRSIPDFSVAVGSPARVIKTLDAVPDVE